MALAIYDVTKAPPVELAGGVVETIKQITLDTDYPTGGWALDPDDFGLESFEYVSCPGVSGYVFQFDYTAVKLLALIGDNNNSSDGVLIEASAGADGLANLNVRCYARGVAA